MRSMITVIGVLVMASIASPAYAQVELHKTVLFVYDDSWQSKAEWDDCIFCIPRTTIRWRALRHEMTLVVKGPNSQYVSNAVNACMQEAVGAGVVAGLAAVYTGGIAMPVAWGAFKTYFFGCLSYKGAGAVSIQIEDRSHWTDWS
ncbi:MAG: hypothetical protein H7Y20_02130 [Bryobacteraceae bacterium]|nr:hypothetical protein [Bryobacteraceae bacterium]